MQGMGGGLSGSVIDGVTPGGRPQLGGSAEPVDDGGAPVSEDVLWRARAEAAEARVSELEEEIASLRAEVESAGQRLDAAVRRGAIDRAVSASDAVDHETVVLLAERALEGEGGGGGADGDVEGALAGAMAALRRDKPFLFGRRVAGASAAGHTGGGAGARASSAPAVERAVAAGEELTSLAEDARDSGDRRALMEYLRRRRAGG